MTLALILQYVLIGFAVVISAAFLAQKQWPNVMRRLRIACALPLLRKNSSQPMQALGRLIAPRPNSVKTECGGCNSCT